MTIIDFKLFYEASFGESDPKRLSLMVLFLERGILAIKLMFWWPWSQKIGLMKKDERNLKLDLQKLWSLLKEKKRHNIL